MIEKMNLFPKHQPWSTYGKKIVLEEMKSWGLEADRSNSRMASSWRCPPSARGPGECGAGIFVVILLCFYKSIINILHSELCYFKIQILD